MQRILEEVEVPAETAKALLVLIPKETQPTTIRSFKPISLCNASLKLVSKMIVHRIKDIWKYIICPFQASFVLGRQSTDNIVLCQEFIHLLNPNKSRKGRIIIKLDLDKAYDRMK